VKGNAVDMFKGFAVLALTVGVQIEVHLCEAYREAFVGELASSWTCQRVPHDVKEPFSRTPVELTTLAFSALRRPSGFLSL
jgi:hypothetical protein